MKRIVAVIAISLTACQAASLDDASQTVEAIEVVEGIEITPHPARPDVLGAFGDQGVVTSVEQWTDERVPALREVFEAQMHGRLPPLEMPVMTAHKVLDASQITGAGHIEQVTLDLPSIGREMTIAIVLPEGEGQHPVLITFAFCGHAQALGGIGGIDLPAEGLPEFCARFANVPSPEPEEDPYLRGLPVDQLLAHGFGIVSFYSGDVVPDDRETAIAVLEAMSASNDPAQRPGAVSAWAWGVSAIVSYLESVDGVDGDRIALMGHSRNGKAAITAAAFDERIALVWAHQSGTGGATLSRTYEGESIENITGGFPHWYAPAYRDWAGREEDLSFDQHQLIAMIAPRPVLLGGAYDDAWAGPEGAFQAAQGADAAYELFGLEGLNQVDMESHNLKADIAFFIRPGHHGITQSDWDRFFSFTDHHFGKN